MVDVAAEIARAESQGHELLDAHFRDLGRQIAKTAYTTGTYDPGRMSAELVRLGYARERAKKDLSEKLQETSLMHKLNEEAYRLAYEKLRQAKREARRERRGRLWGGLLDAFGQIGSVALPIARDYMSPTPVYEAAPMSGARGGYMDASGF